MGMKRPSSAFLRYASSFQFIRRMSGIFDSLKQFRVVRKCFVGTAIYLQGISMFGGSTPSWSLNSFLISEPNFQCKLASLPME